MVMSLISDGENEVVKDKKGPNGRIVLSLLRSWYFFSSVLEDAACKSLVQKADGLRGKFTSG